VVGHRVWLKRSYPFEVIGKHNCVVAAIRSDVDRGLAALDLADHITENFDIHASLLPIFDMSSLVTFSGFRPLSILDSAIEKTHAHYSRAPFRLNSSRVGAGLSLRSK
jgi:hypothetical protein